MQFNVGPWKYRVRVSEGQLLDAASKPVDGLCAWSDRTIWINEVSPLQQRAEILIHEMNHAWTESFGSPATEEDAAKRAASFTVDVWNQLQRQGGIGALMRLRPDGVVDDAAADEAVNDSYAVRCGSCGSLIAIGSVRNLPPAFDGAFGSVVCSRATCCPDCGTRMEWIEGTTATGRPNGRVLSGPVLNAEVLA